MMHFGATSPRRNSLGTRHAGGVDFQRPDSRICGAVIKMEKIIREAEQAGVKVAVVDFSNEERFVTGFAYR